MEREGLACAALPLNEEKSRYALLFGSREGMRALLGGRAERLERRASADAWATRAELCCLIGDESAALTAETAQGLATAATDVLYRRYCGHMPGLTLLPCAGGTHNGERLKEAALLYAVRRYPEGGFMRYLVEENSFRSTLTDCAEWLIEAPKGALPLPEAPGLLRAVDDLAPYRLRRQRMLGGAGVLTAACGALCGVETMGEAMKDADIRALLGALLVNGMLPLLPFARKEGLSYAAQVCAYLQNACAQERWPQSGAYLIGRCMSAIVPALAESARGQGAPSPLLSFALSAVIMLYAGVRENADGAFVLPGDGEEIALLEDARALRAFSRLSCDMPPESLAYAALSDSEVWGCDLRELEGLEERVAGQLRDMQLLGVRGAMNAARSA